MCNLTAEDDVLLAGIGRFNTGVGRTEGGVVDSPARGISAGFGTPGADQAKPQVIPINIAAKYLYRYLLKIIRLSYIFTMLN